MSPVVALDLARLLLEAGQTSDAQQVLRVALARTPDDPAVLELAAAIAEQQGRLAEAAELAERGLAGASELPLAQLRAAYRRIFQLRARLAESITGASEQGGKGMSQETAERAPIDLALDVAARWRAEDPDNAEIDELCATLLFTLGHPTEALRHLDSVIERHPGEGEAYGKVAALLEREGRLEDADRRWQQAAAVEPTNPTWLVSRAHNLIAAGDTATARALALQVQQGKWQERFFAAVTDARELVRQLDALRP
jgi:Flp pilus assembly protein TadD